MFGEASQFLNFPRQQFSMPSRAESAKLQRAEADSFQSQHLVPGTSHQSANLAVLTFLKFEFEDHAATFAAMHMNASEPEKAVGEVHAFSKLPKSFRGRNACDLTSIASNHFKLRMRQMLREIAIVGDQQQTFGVLIESTDGKQSLILNRHKIHSSRTTLWIAVRAENALGLVDQKVSKPRRTKSLHIEPNVVLLRINGSCRIKHDFAIDGDSSRANVLFAVTTRIDSGHRQKLLQADLVFSAFVCR